MAFIGSFVQVNAFHLECKFWKNLKAYWRDTDPTDWNDINDILISHMGKQPEG